MNILEGIKGGNICHDRCAYHSLGFMGSGMRGPFTVDRNAVILLDQTGLFNVLLIKCILQEFSETTF